MPRELEKTRTPAILRFLEATIGGPEKEVMKELKFGFNPKDYSVTQSADWTVTQAKGGLPTPQYNGPKPTQISVELFMDDTEEEGGDVSKTVETLIKACLPTADTKSKNKPSAPMVKFEWGTRIQFKGYLEQVAVKYTLFRSDGTPVRGTANLTIKQFGEPVKPGNPTSGGEPGTTRHRVLAGDTLPSIAYNEFGRADAWRRIANANPLIDDPMRLRPGSVILIPPA